MNLHPFQRSVSEGALHAYLHNIAVASVNEIGLDLHLTIRNENHHSLFQFISGMGYRKMMEFVKKIQMYEQKLTM